MKDKFLMAAGSCSLAIAVLHLVIIIAGGDWYRFFGAGEELATMAENGAIYPAILTAGVAMVFAVWAAYAYSAAGIVRRLPFCKAALVLISAAYVLRGLGGLPLVLLIDNPYLSELRANMVFMLVSSLISLIVGVLYSLGTWRVWHSLTEHQVS